MTKVFVASNPTEAHFWKGLLESNGISSEVRCEALFGARGELPMPETFPELWIVDDSQADEAMKIFDERRRNETEAAAPWSCTDCGETVEAQFTACWRCNTERPVAPN